MSFLTTGEAGATTSATYTIKNVKVEIGNKATTWSQAPEDFYDYTDGRITQAKSEIKQTTDSISLAVSEKVGENEVISKINLSPESVTINANRLNLIGEVSFEMLDTEAQNKITGLESELIQGTQSASTSAWTGASTKFVSLLSGTRISYKLPYESTAQAVTLTLRLKNSSSTGAIPVYYIGQTPVTTQYGAGSVVELIYDGSGWRVINPYSNTDSYDRVGYQQPIQAGASAIVTGNLIVAGSNGQYQHLSNGNNFDITYPILYAGANIAANSTGDNNFIVIPMDLNPTQSGILIPYRSVYIQGQLNGTIFTPVSNAPITQETPVQEDGYEYILLGTAYSSSSFYLLSNHPIFMYYDGGFKSADQIATQAAISAATAQSTADDAQAAADTAQSTIESYKDANDIIIGTQAQATGAWTGVAKFDALQDGQQITYWLPYNGSGNATLNLTLANG